MVTRKQWKRVFKYAVIIIPILGVVYIGIALILPFRTYYQPDSLWLGDGTLINGNLQSILHEDSDYLKVEGEKDTYYYIQVYIQFPNVVYPVLGVAMEAEFKIRKNITYGPNTLTFQPYSHASPFQTQTNFSVIVIYETFLNPIGNTVTIRLSFSSYSYVTPFFIEIDYIKFSIIKLTPSQYMLQLGIVLGSIVGIVALYWYLNRKGFFAGSDGRAVLEKIQRELRKVEGK